MKGCQAYSESLLRLFGPHFQGHFDPDSIQVTLSGIIWAPLIVSEPTRLVQIVNLRGEMCPV